MFAAFVGVAAGCFSVPSMAQGAKVTPRYVVMPGHDLTAPNPDPALSLQTFTISYPADGQTAHATFVGAKSNATTTIETVIIPVKVVITGTGAGTFDPTASINGGLSAVAQTLAGPLYQNSQWTQGGTNLGDTQYEDAVMKGSLWQKAANAHNFHVVWGTPTMEPEITVTCAANSDCGTGTNPFGGGDTIAYFDINKVDAAVTAAISADGITPNQIPIFIMYNTYMISGNIQNCCIGGYHSAEGANQVYGVSTYMSSSSALVFSEDDGALSHELGEIYMDPFVNNEVPGCGILEIGDPLETEPNYGLYTIPFGGYNYHLQDLVFFPYFFQTPSEGVNHWYTFQNETNVAQCNRGA
jgi:hypothetical protein